MKWGENGMAEILRNIMRWSGSGRAVKWGGCVKNTPAGIIWLRVFLVFSAFFGSFVVDFRARWFLIFVFEF